jgi:hypothetical protein
MWNGPVLGREFQLAKNGKLGREDRAGDIESSSSCKTWRWSMTSTPDRCPPVFTCVLHLIGGWIDVVHLSIYHWRDVNMLFALVMNVTDVIVSHLVCLSP